MNILKVVLLALSVSSSGVFAQGQSVVAKIGMDRGGLVIGADYVMRDTPTEAFLGYFSMHSKDDSAGAPGLTAVGAAFKLSQSFGPYEVYLSPGLGLVSYDSGTEDDLLIGPRLAYGLHAELDRSVHLGFENQKIYSWMGEVEGLVADTFLLSVKFGL